MKISLDKTIRAMSIALDLAEISSLSDKNIIEQVSNINYCTHEFTNHSKRTAYIALQLGYFFKLDENKIKSLYLSALLHDIGATNSLKFSHLPGDFIREHCLKGHEIIKPFPIFYDISNIILYHHENFNGSGPMKLLKDNIPFESQIIRISDLVELSYDEKIPTFKQQNIIINWVNSNSNIIFSPKIANAFVSIASKDKFWFDLENISFIDSILDNISPNLNVYLDLDEFEVIALIFSNIIDAKSNFTAMHSHGISKLAFKISNYLGYTQEKCKKMKIAGLLHDIGKLAIPSNILDKKGPLNKDEFCTIKSHVYYTWIILDKISGIEDIRNWASNHHEKLNGSGYPRGLLAKDIDEESRILSICDIYQALTEDRPYRIGLTKEKAFSIMNDMVLKGEICNKALTNLKNALL